MSVTYDFDNPLPLAKRTDDEIREQAFENLKWLGQDCVCMDWSAPVDRDECDDGNAYVLAAIEVQAHDFYIWSPPTKNHGSAPGSPAVSNSGEAHDDKLSASE